MKKHYKLLKLTSQKAVIEVSSLKDFLRIPRDIFNKFAKKKVKITIEVKK